jgi:hypothetical protein
LNGHVGDGRDEHHGGVGVAGAHLAQQLDAVHLRHAQVGEHERRRRLAQPRERLHPRPCLAAGEPVALHEAHEHLPQPRLVVDHQAARR